MPKSPDIAISVPPTTTTDIHNLLCMCVLLLLHYLYSHTIYLLLTGTGFAPLLYAASAASDFLADIGLAATGSLCNHNRQQPQSSIYTHSWVQAFKQVMCLTGGTGEREGEMKGRNGE